jgi:hypothetical protein
MDFSLGGIADAPLVSASIDGRLAVDSGEEVADVATETMEVADTEFWDACWTLEDEWFPGAAARLEPRPQHKQAQLPEVFALL